MLTRLLPVVAASLALAAAAAAIDLKPLKSDQEITFRGAEGVILNGALVLPATENEKKVPAVLLLPGSGPTDRNGNQPPHLVTDLLKQIAERLETLGIASFRFDKRACPRYAVTWPREIDEVNKYFGWQNFIGDARAAYEMLASHPRIQRDRIAILGHSEGGLFALQLAADLAGTEQPVAGLVLAGTAGRTLDHVIREQIRSLLKKQTADAAIRAEMLDHLERAISSILDERAVPNDLPVGLRPLFNPTAIDLLHAYFTVDPAALAANYRGPVLILQGANDAQISAERDAPRLHEAFKVRPGGEVELVIVPETSHNLKKARSTSDPGFLGEVTPEAMQALEDWCRKALKPPA